MHQSSTRFAYLFKKYRLKSEFSTLAQFAFALAEKGFAYEDSIFSHWQKGSRIPQNRAILIKTLEIFIEKKAITTLGQANELLFTAHQGALTEEELHKLSFNFHNAVFQVPTEIVHFSARQNIIDTILHQDIQGKIVFIHGPAGVGKTALAIKLGHLLQDNYADGVLWYKVEEDNVKDILLSIAHVLGEDISGINSLQVRSTVVRSLFSGKNVLLFLDSAELSDNIHLLIPSSPFCTTIITSQKSHLKSPLPTIDVPLEPFTNDEVLELFKEVLQEKFADANKSHLLALAKEVGNLPLAVHILARQLVHSHISLAQLPELLNQQSSFITDIYDDDKSIVTAVAMSYNKLDVKKQSLLLSASIFKGKDFSPESIGYINGLSPSSTTKTLEELVELSLLEHSTKKRFRIHPAIREFIRDRLDYPRSSSLQLIALGIFIFFTVWWVYMNIFLPNNSLGYLIFGNVYSIMALYGGICGWHTSNKWGGIKTPLGRTVLMFSLGLFMQLFGQIAYSYYVDFYKIDAPYPSIGDIGYFGTIPFYIYGSLLLAKASGIELTFRSFRNKLLALIIPFSMVLFAYFLLLEDYNFNKSTTLKIILDFGYPLGEAIYISIAIIIFIFSRFVLDGIMRSKAFILLIALLVQFVVDYIFLYKVDSYYVGNYVDFLCLTSYFIMTLALLNLKSILVDIKP